jgi:NAD(P)-dependent dehydrogenase (short-subunit alcohol dehydrogenase family)
MITDGTVAITGAGAGLGLGLTAEFARRGYKVMALALEEGQRQQVAEAVKAMAGTVEFVVLDVTQPGDFAFPDDLGVLVNNAGIRLENLPVEAVPLDEWRRYFEVNFFGAVELTRRAIPIMRGLGRGVICNVSSGSLVHPMPFLGPYRATKSALSAFSETLRTELAPFGIRIVEFMPGAVRTGMNEKSVTRVIAEAVELPPYAPMAVRQRALFTGAGTLPVEIAAAAVYMVDAIEDQRTKMRHGSCPASTAMIDQWRKDGGEAEIAAFVNVLSGSAA